MFITEEEAIKRLNDPRNFFSPSFRRDSTVEEDKEDNPDKEKIDSIVGIIEDKDPYKIAERNYGLKGKHDIQIAIGSSAEIIGNRSAGHLYNLGRDQVKAYNHGVSGLDDMYKGVDRVPHRKVAMENIKATLSEIAANKLKSALNHLTDDKISEQSASRVSTIARDMATVMDRVSRDNKNQEHVHFHVFTPEIKKIGDYSTVRVTSPLVVGDGDK